MEACISEEIIHVLVKRAAVAAREAANHLPQTNKQGSLEAQSKGVYQEEVTIYDKELEKIIMQSLKLADRNDAYLGEETGQHYGNSGIKWIIDPIDGTLNFIRQLPAYVVSIAAELDGKVVAGAIYDPSHKDLFTAGQGLGAWCNGYKINCSTTNKLSEAVVSTGFSKQPEVRGMQANIIANLLTKIRDVRSSGSAALDLCWLAAGKLDAYYEHDLKYWDFAAGALIASEAGAIITIQSDFITAANPVMSPQLMSILTQ